MREVHTPDEEVDNIEQWVVNTATLHELGMALARQETPEDGIHWYELAKEAARQFELALNRTRDRIADDHLRLAAKALYGVFVDLVRDEDQFKKNGAASAESR